MSDTETNEPTVTTGEVVSEPVTTGEWLTPPEAATRLGISERTLWRYIDQGRYHKRVRDRRAEILVPVSGATPAPSSKTALAPTPDTGAILEKLEEITRRVSRQSMTVTRQAVQITRLTADRQRLQAERDTERERAAELQLRLAEEQGKRWWRKLWGW